MSRALSRSASYPLATLRRDVERARRAAASARAPATLEAYGRAWRSFRAWCASVRDEVPGAQDLPTPPEVIAIYLSHISEERGYKPATLDLHLASIVWGHRQHGMVFDRRAVAVADVRAGFRRAKGIKPKQARPLLVEDLRVICAEMGTRLIDVRDRAILLVAFAGAFRSAELLGLSGLRGSDCKRTKAGYELTVRRSKTDQEGEGFVKHVSPGKPETCPVAALDAWLAWPGHEPEAPVFLGLPGRTGQACSGRPLSRLDLLRILQRRAERAGVDPEGLTGHAPRAGLVTEAVEAGVEVRDIMAVTGHRDRNTLEGYVRRRQAKIRPAAKGLL